MEPQLRQVITEAWRDVLDVDRSKQVKKVTDKTYMLQTSVKFRDFEELYLYKLSTNHFQTWLFYRL